jgi:hypothetical protein
MSLPEKLFKLKGFRNHFEPLLYASVRGQFSALVPPGDLLETAAFDTGFDSKYLLTCASVLARSNEGQLQDTALRIAQHLMTRPEATDVERAGAAVILDMLANRPAIDLAIRSYKLRDSVFDELPLPLRLDSLRRRYNATLELREGRNVLLNKFQQGVRDAFDRYDVLSISAPTSAGKSFVLQRLLEAALLDGRVRRAAFIVPTRALIQQTELDLQQSLAALGMQDILVTGTPGLPENWEAQQFVLIFTQERLHWLLRDAPAEFSLDLLFIDEAQKVGDGPRGILLEQAIAAALARNVACKTVFCSPLSDNPSTLLKVVARGDSLKTFSLVSDYSAVNQNLLWATQVPRKPLEWQLEYVNGATERVLGTFTLPNRPSPDSKRLPLVAHCLGQWRAGNLVYVNGPADAEKVATLLADLCPKVEAEAMANDAELRDLSQLAATTVHASYALVETARKGVGFHYGNMPSLLRFEIERLFKLGKLRYLVCTSTLLEGVNLAARTMFIRGPKRGIGNPMTEGDFWNLAGRAGRLGRDFQGNVVCIDARDSEVWSPAAPRERRRYHIGSSFRSIIRNQLPALRAYVANNGPIETSRDSPEIDYVIGYLVSLAERHGSVAAAKIDDDLPDATLHALERLVTDTLDATKTSSRTISRHPGISPFAIARLRDFFVAESSLDEMSPVLPESADAVKHYASLINRISVVMSGDPPALSFPHALMVVRWMRGWPLARIISGVWDYWNEKSPGKKTIDQVIREVMEQIEVFVRFKFLKYVSCYSEVLRDQMALLPGGEQQAASVPSIELSLEFGASTQTQLSFMALGLSRTSAIALSDALANDSLTVAQAREWLMKTQLDGKGLAAAVIREIQRTVLKAE